MKVQQSLEPLKMHPFLSGFETKILDLGPTGFYDEVELIAGSTWMILGIKLLGACKPQIFDLRSTGGSE